MKFQISCACGRKPPCDGITCVGDDCFGLDPYYEIEANSIDDILRIADIDPDGIIILRTPSYKKHNCEWEIMIYDGYIE